MQVQIKKIESAVEVQTEKFNDEVKAFIFEYGIKQILNDCHSQINKNTVANIDELVAGVNKAITDKLESLYSGKLSARGTGTPKTSKEYQVKALAAIAVELGAKGTLEQLVAAFGKVKAKDFQSLLERVAKQFNQELESLTQRMTKDALKLKLEDRESGEGVDIEDVL